LKARRDVLTQTIIIDAFERCGQFPFSDRAIIAKAERARQRCGSGQKWKETEDLSLDSLQNHPLMEIREQLAIVTSQVSSYVASHRSGRVPANLREVVKQIETAQEAAQEAWEKEFSERASSAQAQVDEIASQPVPNDPALFNSHPTFDESAKLLYPPSLENKNFLDEQHKQMQNVLKALTVESAQQLNAQGGSYLVDPNSISSRERQMVREKWIQSLKSHRKFIREELVRQADLLKSCLNSSCSAKKGRRAWQKCSICQRGYCPECGSQFSISSHMTSSHPDQFVTTSVTNSLQTTTTIIRIPRSTIPSVSNLPKPSSSSTSSSSTSSVVETTPAQAQPLNQEIADGGFSRCHICFCLLIDSSIDCQNCLHQGFANSDTPIITTVVQTSCTTTQSTVRTVQGYCLGCGMTRTLEACSNGHLRCRRCIINCHECQSPKRRSK